MQDVFAAANYQVQQAANPYSTYTQQPSYNTQTLKGKVVMIPAGVSIPAMTKHGFELGVTFSRAERICSCL